ncbi:MAG: hypothetical protein FJ284_11645 [Planctomycetes bacterium]|nr:hypothetical protein [Planctomycetota bacterium]
MLGPIVPQPAPTIAIAADTGSSTTDGITQTGMVLVAGVAVGAKWQYRYAGGSWTDGSGSSFVLPDGSYPVGDVQVRQIVAGFSSVPATNPRQWIIDSKTPDAPIITSVVDDALLVVGPLGNGAVTNDAMPTFIGKAEAGATLRITVNSSPWAAITIPSDGIWSYTFTVLTDGPYTFTFVAVDSAGNESLPATFGLTIDTVAPFVTITSVADDVINSIGNLVSGASTNDTTPTFTGTSEAGVKLRIVVNGGTPSFITVPAGGIWTYTPTPLLDGAYTFSFTAVDAAGNDSPAVFFALTVDTVAPPAPVITSVVDDVAPATGSIANGATTNDSTPTFTGTATPGMTLRVIVDNGVPAFSTVPANGIWTFVPQSLGEGNHTFSFTAIDAAANRSLITSLSLVVDTIAPTTPVITAVTDNVAPVSGSLVSGGFTNDPTPTFTGTADAGTTLRITTNGGTPTTITVPAGGAWTYTPTLANGAYAFSFVAVDAAGNESGAAAFSLTVDTIAPQVTGVLALSPSGTYGIGQSVDIQVTFSEPVTVTGAPSLQLNTTPLRSAVYVSGSGTDVFLFRYAIQTGDVSTRLDYTSTVAFGGGSFPDAAGNPASLTLPPVGTFLGKNIAIDALIKATVVGLGQWPSDPPDFASAVAAFQVQFNTPVTGFAVGSISLQRLDNPADPASGRAVSLTGVSVSGSGTNWTITLPSATNPTSLKGRYKLVIGGVNSGIQSGGVTMNIPGEWYFDRI